MKTYLFILTALIGFNSYSQFPDSTYKALDFELHKNLIIANAYVNGKSAKFIVDTGASVSLVDQKQYKKYKFTYSVSLDDRLTGFGGKSRMMQTSAMKFRLDGFDLEATYRFSACDLGDVNVALSETNQRILGILGSDFLKNHHAIIDYQNQKIYFKFLY